MKKLLAVENDDHPSAEKANRFPEDILLRGHGFVIRMRLNNRPAYWSRDGVWFTHREAMALVRRAIREVAQAR